MCRPPWSGPSPPSSGAAEARPVTLASPGPWYTGSEVDDPSTPAALRRLPAVGALLEDPGLVALIAAHGRPLVTRAARAAVESARSQLRAGASATVGPAEVRAALEVLAAPALRPVLNATGVVLHTNLGRAPLAEAAWQAAAAVAQGYSNLELDLDTGVRGDRHVHVGALLAELLGAEAGLVFNNCAGATLLMLAALCRGREVIVARGELVEIGGGFRVPDVLRESGAHLVEVGTTNKVYVRDYAAAITERTGAILHVHRSNFALVGFTAEPGLPALAALAHARGLPLLADLGSGLLAEDADLGPAAAHMAHEPRPRDAVAAGADVVAFSGDKLLGGPQAGLLAGRRALLEQVKVHPLARALRADKLTLAALEATLRLYRDGRALQIPTVRALAVSEPVLALRAQALAQALWSGGEAPVALVDGESVPGGGALPLCRLPTRLVLVGGEGPEARGLLEALRAGDPPVVARIVDDRVALDVRTVPDEAVATLARRVGEAWRALGSSRTRAEEESTP
jgi:L-seryl-tRNA(Ser) seleniumtransferase